MSFKTRIYQLAVDRNGRGVHEDLKLSSPELIYYLWKRGGWSRLRGLLRQHRFQRCGGRLFVGRKAEILFPQHISVGRNVYLGDYSYINGLSREGFQFGDNVRIREYAWIQATSSLEELGQGLVIGDDTYIGPRCYIGAGGGITIGCHVTLGASVDLLAENHQFADADRLINEQGVTQQGIVIEDDVWIGNRATVLDGVRIGKGAVVGAASVVTKDVEPYTVVMGNPARVVSRRVSAKSHLLKSPHL